MYEISELLTTTLLLMNIHNYSGFFNFAKKSAQVRKSFCRLTPFCELGWSEIRLLSLTLKINMK